MRPVKCVILIATLASATMLAQSQSNQSPPQNPAGQARQSSTAAANTSTFTGTIVSAECSQASSLTSSSSFADRNVSSSTSPATSSTGQDASASSKSTTEGTKESGSSTTISKDYRSVYDRQREVMRHCPASSSTTSFAVLTDAGSFYKLDDAGNSQVMSQVAGSDSDKDKKKKNLKNMRVTVTGNVQGDSLKVQSLTKTDKPFGSS